MEEVLIKLSWDVINDYIDKDLLIINKHPEYDIWILNYSKTCQFERAWDNITLSCRGLIIDNDCKIIGRSFRKFFNYEEVAETINVDRPFEAYEKMDGSLIILFYYAKEQKWIVASRGSFISDQSELARKIVDEKIDTSQLSSTYTYVFELIAPSNRIVIDYGNVEDLFLLGCINTISGDELSYDEMYNMNKKIFPIVKRYYTYGDAHTIDDIRKIQENNREGFVIRFEDGERIKIKFEEYVKLHRIITNVSNKTVWEYLMNDLPFDELLENVPDEFYDWLKKTKSDLERQFIKIEHEILKEFYQIYFKEGITERKAFAEKALQSKNRGFLFALYSSKDYCKAIWKKIRPVYSKPFRDGYDDN
jgi:RNA ligase